MSNYGKRMVPEYLLKRLEELNSVELPVKIDNVTNIAALTDDEINSLEAGDIVVKKTGNQKHTYIVTYKENNQGICLTYADATYIETVSYDYTAGHWVYNSKDSIELQPKLTAGDNISITDGVISATDTTYTAGTNITIEDGVISAAGGDVELYQHIINLGYAGSNYTYNIRINIYTKSSVAFTKATFLTYLQNLNSHIPLACSGEEVDTGNNKIYIITGITASGGNYQVTRMDETTGLETTSTFSSGSNASLGDFVSPNIFA